jgi:hypothetical protein
MKNETWIDRWPSLDQIRRRWTQVRSGSVRRFVVVLPYQEDTNKYAEVTENWTDAGQGLFHRVVLEEFRIYSRWTPHATQQ